MSKKILVLTPRFPYPLIGGDKIRILSIVKGLIREGHKVSLISFITSRQEVALSQESELGDIFSSIKTVLLPKWKSYLNVLRGLISRKPLQVFYYQSGKMKLLIDQELSLGKYDVVLVHLIRMAPYVIGRNDIQKVLEMTDAISLNYARSRQYRSGGLLGIMYRIEEERVRRYEQRCIERFDFSVVVSGVDRDHLIKTSNKERHQKIKVIPHGVQDLFLKYDFQDYDPNLLVFIGNLRTLQNNDAILYFVKEIYPFIKLHRPAARLRIVGANPSKVVRNLDNKNGVKVTGKVENIVDYVKDACVSVSPIRIGAGMRGKILESMAMGIPVVATSVGVEGIEEARSDNHLLIADTPESFANAVIKVMENPSLRDSLSKAGRELARRYRYSAIAQEYAKLFD